MFKFEYNGKDRYYFDIINILSSKIMRKIDRFLQYLDYKGITENKATTECGLAQGILHQAKSGKSDLGYKTIDKITMKYQDLNRDWLVSGYGEMLKNNINQSANGNGNTQVAGNGNTVTPADFGASISKALDEIAEQRKLVAKAQEQIDRLIGLLERK